MWYVVAQQLDTARALAERDAAQASQASLRRAVSTAYYAVFQALCSVCADTLVGSDKPWDVFAPVFRALDHSGTIRVLRQDTVSNTPELRRLCIAFGDLQAARSWADYSPEPRPNFEVAANPTPFTLDEALALIGFATEAVEILDRLDEPTRLRLATRLVPKSRK